MIRSNSRPRKRTRDRKITAAYWEIWGGLPCEWGILVGESCRGEELNHILCGQRKEDAFWNLVMMCHRHHQDQQVGFHGVNHREMRERILQMKIDQGFVLPREAYAYLPEGIDGAPQAEADEENNRQVLEGLADSAQQSSWDT